MLLIMAEGTGLYRGWRV